MKLDWSGRGWPRVCVFTVIGTVACIGFAFAFDSYSFTTGTWRWGTDPVNNLLIPLLIAPPFFFLLLSKMRQLSIALHELMTVAMTDGLTSLLNRRAFMEMVDGYFERARKAATASSGAFLLIDIDDFKIINDRFGHDTGDEALKLVADTIAASVRETDLVCRIGGEEFCVFIPGQSPENIRMAAERIRAAVHDAAFIARGQRHHLSVSVGGVIFDRDASFSYLYRGADEGLYLAKRTGRNRVELSSFATAAAAQQTMH
jgi:diguanylate cyclase (GGDEF)-like protein